MLVASDPCSAFCLGPLATCTWGLNRSASAPPQVLAVKVHQSQHTAGQRTQHHCPSACAWMMVLSLMGPLGRRSVVLRYKGTTAPESGMPVCPAEETKEVRDTGAEGVLEPLDLGPSRSPYFSRNAM